MINLALIPFWLIFSSVLIDVLWWLLWIFLIVKFIRWIGGKGDKKSKKIADNEGIEIENDSALEVLRIRYAKGEITKKEFDKIKRDLE